MDLIKHIEENFFAVCRYWGSLNFSFTQAGSIGAMNTGVAIADINWVWNEKPLTSANANSIADIKEIYQKKIYVSGGGYIPAVNRRKQEEYYRMPVCV